MSKKVVLLLVALGLLFLPALVLLADEPMRPELRLPCKVVDVYDGDTLTVHVTIPIKIRLLDCWAPEIRGVDAETKARGEQSRDHLSKLAKGKAAILQVPIPEKADSLGDLFSFERVLGYVLVGDDQRNLSVEQVRAGHATKERASNE